MNSYRSKGIICVKGKCNMTYALCAIEYILNEDETYEYTFSPYYSVIDLLGTDIFQGIPGLNLDRKKEIYVRENRIPTFISERVPGKNRENYYEILEELDMEYMDPIVYLIRTKQQYSGDNLFVVPYHDKEIVSYDNYVSYENNNSMIKDILVNICMGNDVEINGQFINDSNRKLIHDILISIYYRTFKSMKERQRKGIRLADEEGKYTGRKPIKVDYLKYCEMLEKVEKGEMTVKEAALKLGISIDKYYRVRKQLQNSNNILTQYSSIEE